LRKNRQFAWRKRGTRTMPGAVDRVRAHVLEENGRDDVVRVGLNHGVFTDLYHTALTASWWRFFWGSLLLYIVVNLFFGELYFRMPGGIANTRPGMFSDCFFFSVQTLSTVGYGLMAPVGPVANTIVSVEVLVGMMFNALGTGLVFARFSRPRARILFSRRAVLGREEGVPILEVRIANCRRSLILAMDIEVTLALLARDEAGRLMRQFIPLKLVQSHAPILRFVFHAAHVIDESSPLHGRALTQLEEGDAEIIVTVAGTDEITAQGVFARTAYSFEHIAHHHRFAGMVSHREDGHVVVDYARFHDVEPLESIV
jgi:inward rectifier potassium channel